MSRGNDNCVHVEIVNNVGFIGCAVLETKLPSRVLSVRSGRRTNGHQRCRRASLHRWNQCGICICTGSQQTDVDGGLAGTTVEPYVRKTEASRLNSSIRVVDDDSQKRLANFTGDQV